MSTHPSSAELSILIDHCAAALFWRDTLVSMLMWQSSRSIGRTLHISQAAPRVCPGRWILEHLSLQAYSASASVGCAAP